MEPFEQPAFRCFVRGGIEGREKGGAGGATGISLLRRRAADVLFNRAIQLPL